MPSTDREDSRDRELVRHSHSFSSIPMWDSSDPDRAPPPLPLNPGSPNLTTRPNTSALIMQAAKALEEKARESLPASSYTTNPMPQKSPERSLIKGTQHKRMQSLQPGSVRDLRSYLDTHRSPERSPERPATRGASPARDLNRDYFSKDAFSKDPFVKDPEPLSSRNNTPTPSARFEMKDTSPVRPSHRAILGENTPPSATMMALQTMTIPPHILDPPLQNVTNSPARSPPVLSQPLDSISTQLLSINSIVSSLQKDMSQLSRRSKDNATDLISLKEATNSRDEDIRKSLKDLLHTMAQKQQSAAAAPGDASRSSSLNLQDPHMTPTKQFTFPRMPSPNGWGDERIGSPNPYSVEGAASVAMLEKIIREMVTKDGQDRLIASLQKLVDKATGETAKKVTELAEFVKQGSTAHAMAAAGTPGSASFQASPGSGALTRTMTNAYSSGKGVPYTSPKAADFVSDEMLKFLRKIKDSVAEAGGVTMSTKSLVQDLRGEVLGMGRELARKIEEAERVRSPGAEPNSSQTNPDISTIVQQELSSLKEHMDKVMRDRRRQSMSSTITRNTVDSNEVYGVVRHALAERGLDKSSPQTAALDKEAIIGAVREAYDSVELNPNVEIQQFGLERDEILQCLREGLQDYRGSGGVTKDDVENIVHDSLQQIKLPAPINEAHEIREEILLTVRECLEDFKPATAQDTQFSVEIPPEQIIDAVKVALEQNRPQVEEQNNAVMQRLESLLDKMHCEFKDYSSANGRDTEQVLDALHDGLDHLRTEIQSVTTSSRDVTETDHIVDHISLELEKLREDVQGYVAEGPRGDQAWNRGDMVSYIKSEFENLHEKFASQFLPATNNKEDLIAAINAGFEEMKSQVALRTEDDESSDDINEAMKHEFDQLKEVILGDSASHKNDVLEKLQAGLDGLHTLVGESYTSTTPNDDMLVAMKEEFEHLRHILGGSLVRSSGVADKDDIVDAVRELIDGLRSSQESVSKENVTIIESQLEAFKESLSGALVPAGDADKAALLETLKAGLEEIKSTSKSGVNEELLEALRGELEQIRQSDGLTRQHSRADTEEVLEAVRLGLDDLRSHLEKRLDGPDHHASASGEIIDAMNEGLDGLRAEVGKVADKPVDMTVSYEILETLKDGLAGLRQDIEHLKSASHSIDIPDHVPPTGNEVVLAEDSDAMHELSSREIVEGISSNDMSQDQDQHDPQHGFQRMELILAQIQEKVESMDANIHTSREAPSTEETTVPGAAMKEDLTAIEELLKDVQAAVLLMQDREASTPILEGIARKEDTDAIETLLANTKAKIEDIILPDPDTMVTKENLEDVELVVRTTSEALETLAKKIEDEGATKADVTVIQIIADDIKQTLDEMRAVKPDDETDPKATKADVDAVSLLVDDVKVKLDEIKLPDPDTLPLKFDIEQLTGLIHDFRDSHDKMKDTYEEDIMKTARNFEDRKFEAEAIQDHITEVKTVLDEMKMEITTHLIDGTPIETLKESFKTLEETLGSSNVTSDVKELMETVSREFERAHGSIEFLQNDQAEKSALQLEKHDELKDAIVTGFTEKLDDKFNVLMAKYDDAQLLADEQARVMKEKADEQEKILESTKTMADELRLTIDTLGASIAGMNDRFEDATMKWSSDSTAVSSKLDETLSKFEEQKLEDKTEHSHTRDEIKNIESVFTNLQDNVTEYHPKFMVALREIESLVKAHYDHAQKSKEEADDRARAWEEENKTRGDELLTHFANLPKLLPASAPTIDTQEKYDDAPVQEKLDKLLAIEPSDSYDDAIVQEKLDKLLNHADEALQAAGQFERLDEIHAQVKVTAAELSDFVAKQTQLITDGNESKEREAEELALLVERKKTQKEQLEADLENLRIEKATQKEQLAADIQDIKADRERVLQELREEKERVMAELKEEKDRTMLEIREEKDSLLAVVAALQVERENLANQKVRLTGEVSSLHTALDIRREELNLMDAKADALERRILNGIMDHSRALMMVKGGSKSPSKKHKKHSAVDSAADEGKLLPPPSTAANGLSLALKPRPAIRRNGAPANLAQRRILSLSQISGNAPAPGHQSFPTINTAVNSGGGIKRSHSVKNSVRKGSWGGRPGMAIANKENGTLKEEDEMETERLQPIASVGTPSIIEEDQQSETGTERRYSVDSRSYAESYAEGETPGYDGRSSFGGTGSQYSYASGSSYMTGSDVDRRTSCASTGAHGEEADEHSVNEHSDAESGAEDDEPTATIKVNPSEMSIATSDTDAQLPTHSEIGRAVEAVKKEMKDEYAPPSDSGVGTDIATAVFGNESEVDADYFRRAAEEEASAVG
ncbi:hypothetical protein BDU57DRAFT_473824 [Ampelomyces quisqualis]|uniref:Chromosome segregation ATPase family protein n=1 Tax=Ampelomyces quisqualis TaxID=50730 RepID=A0A6A5QKN7_AMPQU|nr:hypothetical protein BDU57DRAFT_473824 [Ampelomyces quisqualis]